MYEFHICKNICGSISLLIYVGNYSGTIFLFLKLLRYIEMTAQYTLLLMCRNLVQSYFLCLFYLVEILFSRIQP